MVSHHVTVSRKLNANYSILGRLIRRSVRDAYYAEGILILTIALICIGMVVSFYVAWAFVEPFVQSDSAGQVAVNYALAQLGSVFFLVLVALLGFKPRLEITVEDHSIHIKQGSEGLLLLKSELLQVEVISATQFHQHYRKYANTKAFYNKLNPSLLMLETENGPVVLGVSNEDQATLLEALRSSASAETDILFEFVA